jgi:hypothetical protein
MVNLGAFAGPYIPTTTVAVARNANLLYYTGADVPNIKSLSTSFLRAVGVSNSNAIVALSDNTVNERVMLYLNTATEMNTLGVDGGVALWILTASNAYTPGTLAKSATSFATNDVKFSANGIAQTPDTAATMPTVDRLEIGMRAGAVQFNGAVNHVYGWTRNLSQSELNAVTAP